MDQHRFDAFARSVSRLPSRRHVLRGLAAFAIGWGVGRLPESAEAKKKRKPKTRKGVCRKNGSPCQKPGKNCQKRHCLRAPFTIEAVWTETADHDTVLFVPPENETTGPSPHIHHGCNPDDGCVEAYPFACVSQDAQGPGDEITTISRLLRGTYEYWIELSNTTPAGELTVVLKDSGGRIVRRWANPANPLDTQVGWHVFDVDGNDGRVTAIDELLDDAPLYLPSGAHDPSTNVCPD